MSHPRKDTPVRHLSDASWHVRQAAHALKRAHARTGHAEAREHLDRLMRGQASAHRLMQSVDACLRERRG